VAGGTCSRVGGACSRACAVGRGAPPVVERANPQRNPWTVVNSSAWPDFGTLWAARRQACRTVPTLGMWAHVSLSRAFLCGSLRAL